MTISHSEARRTLTDPTATAVERAEAHESLQWADIAVTGDALDHWSDPLTGATEYSQYHLAMLTSHMHRYAHHLATFVNPNHYHN